MKVNVSNVAEIFGRKLSVCLFESLEELILV